MADAEDIYDVAPTSSETVKDFSKLIGRFDQKQRPASVVRPVRPTVSLKPVQLPPKKGAISPGPLSPGAIVSANMVSSARKQLSVVPNKRESCVRASQYPTPDPQQSSGPPPEIPSKKKAAPPPMTEVAEVVESPPPHNGTTSIEHRPPPAVPVESVRPNSVQVSTTEVPGYDNSNNIKRSSQSNYSDVKHYRQLPVPPLIDNPPPKPSRPPHVQLPDIDDILQPEELYDDVRQRGPDSRAVSMIREDEYEDTEPPLPRRQSREKTGQSSRSVRRPPTEVDQVYDEVQQLEQEKDDA